MGQLASDSVSVQPTLALSMNLESWEHRDINPSGGMGTSSYDSHF